MDARVVSVAVGREHVDPPSPYLAAGLAVIVGVVVFAALFWVRRTFGLKR